MSVFVKERHFLSVAYAILANIKGCQENFGSLVSDENKNIRL